MHQFRTLARVWFLFAILVAATAASPQAEPPFVDQIEAAPGVLLFRPESAIGNPTSVAILGDHETVLLDANLPEIVPLLQRALAARQAKPVRYVVTSHAHRDHTDGLPLWLAAGAAGIAPDGQAKAIADSPVIHEAIGLSRRALPELSFSERFRLDLVLGGVSVAVEMLRPSHRHGHTDADLVVHLPSRRVLYVGDYFFVGRYPIIDLEGGGSFEGYLANLDWITTVFPADTLVIPGHNRFAPNPIALPGFADLKAWTARLRASIARVDAAKSAGLTLDETIARGLGPDFSDLSERPRFVSEERWIRAVWSRDDAID